jgi:tRNA(Ile)-lysidine synthase
MQSSVFKYITDNTLPLPPNKLVVGVSGGADSVALLHILKELGYDCMVAHCNFHLRGEESDRDAVFVEKLAVRFQFPFYKVDFDTTAYAQEHKISIEMAARELRYDWFEKIRVETNAAAIAIAHHADDMVETLLLNLVRGTGIKGLSGIKAKQGFVIRPLLSIWRSEIETYLKENQLEFVTDSTNSEEIYLRNKFRHTVIPLLEEINPAVKKTLLKEIELLHETEILYKERIEEIAQRLITKNDNEIYLDINSLGKEKAQKSILFEILSEYNFSADSISIIHDCLQSDSGKQFFSSTHRIIKDRDFLIITPIGQEKQKEFVITKEAIKIEQPLCVAFRTISKAEFQLDKNKNKAYFDADLLQFPLKIRHWQSGDAFVPFGMTGMKKLSDYFIDKKYSLPEKEKALLLVSGKDIMWIMGERTDDRYKITDNTKNIFEVTIETSETK